MFVYEDHKLIAGQILSSIVPKKGLQIAAGGHLGYAPCGALYTNAPPNHSHMYGSVIDQIQNLPNHRLGSDHSIQAAATNNFIQLPIYQNNLSENTVHCVDNKPRSHDFDQRREYLNPDKLRSTYA